MKPLLPFATACLAVLSLARADSRLTNVSVRSAAGSGAETLIVGFTIAGGGTKSLLVRGIGPTLSSFGVAGAVADPELRLYNSVGAAVAENDDWSGQATLAAAASRVAAFALPASSLDAALLATLPAGSYSAHVAAKSGSGIALLEAYDADPAASAA